MFFQDPELAALLQGRSHHNASGIVSGTAGVVPQPYGAIAEGPAGLWVVVGPQRLIGVAALQVGKGEGAHRAVDELAHVELIESLLVVLQAQSVDVEQVAPARLGIEDRDDLAPLAVRAEHASANLRLARPRACVLAALAVAELLTCPEGIGLVGHRTGRGEVRLSPLGMAGHGAGQTVELGEIPDPEILVDVDVAMVALGGAAVGG